MQGDRFGDSGLGFRGLGFYGLGPFEGLELMVFHLGFWVPPSNY